MDKLNANTLYKIITLVTHAQKYNTSRLVRAISNLFFDKFKVHFSGIDHWRANHVSHNNPVGN
jgi:hypothetical protein